MSVHSDPDRDFAAYYGDGGDPDRDCERLYVWHRALWSRAEAGVAPYRLEVIHGRGYGLFLHAADGSQFWLGSDGMIPTWSSAGWTKGLGADLVAETAKDASDFSESHRPSVATSSSRATASARRGGRSTRLAGCTPRSLTASTSRSSASVGTTLSRPRASRWVSVSRTTPTSSICSGTSIGTSGSSCATISSPRIVAEFGPSCPVNP